MNNHLIGVTSVPGVAINMLLMAPEPQHGSTKDAREVPEGLDPLQIPNETASRKLGLKTGACQKGIPTGSYAVKSNR